MKHRLSNNSGVIFIIITMVVTACSVNPVTGKNNFVLMSEDDEIKLGRESHSQIAKQFGGEYSVEALQAYVQRVGEKLALNSHRPNLIYRFTVIDSPTVNAFAIPGGYIYITRGLMAYLNSEAELAAVLGHEIGHVTARHSVRQISLSKAAGIGYQIGAILIPELRTQGVSDLFGLLSNALISGYGRDQELEADRLGAEYLARSGYDPQAMVGVIGVLKNQERFEKQLAKEEGREPRVYHGVFASHPDNDTRLQQVVQSADKFKSANAMIHRREAFLKQIEKLVFGDSEASGILRGQKFYHKGLEFGLTFPAGWKIENMPDHLVAVAPKQRAVLQLMVKDINKRIPPVDFLMDSLKIKRFVSDQDLNPNGLDGHSVVVSLNTAFGKRNARMSVIYHDKQAFTLVGYAKDKSSPKPYDKVFLDTARSFHALEDREKELASALEIHLLQTDAAMTFKQLAEGSAITHHAEEQLRLLNGMYPNGEPSPGQLIKIVN
ncbi:MAG: M48 family metalloprotease [Gammaproteobacteria bacterium]